MKKYRCPSCEIELDSNNIEEKLEKYEKKPWYELSDLVIGKYCPNCGIKIRLNHAGKKWLWLTAPLFILFIIMFFEVKISIILSSISAILLVFGVMMYVIKSEYEIDE